MEENAKKEQLEMPGSQKRATSGYWSIFPKSMFKNRPFPLAPRTTPEIRFFQPHFWQTPLQAKIELDENGDFPKSKNRALILAALPMITDF